MRTIIKSMLFLLPVLVLNSAEAAVQKGANPYTVQSGDSLFDIAQAYLGDGNQWKKIAQANNIDVNNRLFMWVIKSPFPLSSSSCTACLLYYSL